MKKMTSRATTQRVSMSMRMCTSMLLVAVVVVVESWESEVGRAHEGVAGGPLPSQKGGKGPVESVELVNAGDDPLHIVDEPENGELLLHWLLATEEESGVGRRRGL